MAWISLRQGVHRMLPSLTVQPVYKVGETLKLLPEGAKICDIGAGGRKITPDTYTIDGFVTENTDTVCDIHHIPLPDESFDCIFCTGTLEHVEDPAQAMSEIYRLVKKGGIVHIEVPFMQGFHADPHDYWRWTIPGLRLFCTRAGLTELECGTHIGPASALNWVLNECVACLCGNGRFGNAVAALFRFIPLKYLDYILVSKGSAARVASGIYFVGRK